jgi:hypothetical protein
MIHLYDLNDFFRGEYKRIPKCHWIPFTGFRLNRLKVGTTNGTPYTQHSFVSRGIIISLFILKQYFLPYRTDPMKATPVFYDMLPNTAYSMPRVRVLQTLGYLYKSQSTGLNDAPQQLLSHFYFKPLLAFPHGGSTSFVQVRFHFVEKFCRTIKW